MSDSSLDRRDFLRLGAAVTAAGLVPREFLSASSPQLQLEEAGVFDLSTRIASGELTVRALTELYLQRIESIDRGGPRINCVIVVERTSQKKIIIGKGASRLKQIGIAARRDIEELLGHRVHLELFVKVEEDWRNDARLLDEYGLA